ncbi:MAG: DUF512 domain-containing protein [Chloroflexi bacterium]|nr:DUF512 domain-containing protein [Chloroflexota bacterium]
MHLPTKLKPSKEAAGTIANIRPNTAGARLGLLPGDRIVAVDGQPIKDVLDYQFRVAGGAVELTVERAGSQFVVFVEEGEQPGIEFAAATFDGVRRCANKCRFCFVDQLPPSLRPSLYIKDDDYRCSMLNGNFVTLTNLRESDWRRFAEQRLGPLYVSVHATDLAVRRFLLRNDRAPDLLPQLRRLASLGIAVQVQVVLCPGVNDGEVLEQTTNDLSDLWPSVRGVGVVPVSIARDCEGLRPVAFEDAVALVDRVQRLQRGYRKRFGVGFLYLADEFYLLANRAVPSARLYDGFAQYENGIGMVRTLQDDWQRLRLRLATKSPLPRRHLTVACGRLIEPLLARITGELAAVTGWVIDLVPVENRLFGKNVTVSGLLGGRDVLRSLEGRALGDAVVLPRTVLDAEGARCLDDLTPREMERALGLPVHFASTLRQLVDLALAP